MSASLYVHHLPITKPFIYLSDTTSLYDQSLRSDYVLEVFTLTSSASSRILLRVLSRHAMTSQDVTNFCSTLDSTLELRHYLTCVSYRRYDQSSSFGLICQKSGESFCPLHMLKSMIPVHSHDYTWADLKLSECTVRSR
jgi:hypothetical protein